MLSIYLVILYIVFSALTTCVASAVHGRDFYGKGVIIAVHSFLSPFVAPLFWAFFRRGWQARAEMDYLKLPHPIEAVVKAYPLWIGHIIAPVIEYCYEKPWEHLGIMPTRAQQEMCAGFVIGAILSIPSAAVIFWLI